MPSTTAKKKTLYHSEAANLGPVLVTITTDVLESKYKKGSYYVGMKIEGEERSYTVENDACAEALADRKGQTCLLTFSGSRDDAEISIGAAPLGKSAQAQRQVPTHAPISQIRKPRADQSAVPARNVAPEDDQVPGAEVAEPAAEPPPPRNAPHAPKPNGDALVLTKLFLNRQANASVLAANAVHYAVGEFRQMHGLPWDKPTQEAAADAISQSMCSSLLTRFGIALSDTWRDEQNDLPNKLPTGVISKLLAERDAAKKGAAS